MSLSLAELPSLPEVLSGTEKQALGSGEQVYLAKAGRLLPTRSSESLAKELSCVQCPAVLKGQGLPRTLRTFFI